MKFYLIFSVLLYAFAAIPVRVDNKPPVHTIVEGDNLLIVCNATKTNETEVFWKKKDTKSVFRENSKKLEILYIKRAAAGEYICYSLNLTSESSATIVQVVSVDVLYPAEVTEFSLGPNTVREGSTFSIHCKIVGNPDPVWSIMNNRTNASMIKSTMAAGVDLTSWPATCSDAGFWMCTGHNYLNHNRNTTQGSNVTILCSPSPKSNITYRVRSAPWQATNLVMNNDGYPYPNYTWSYKGQALPSSMSISGEWFSILMIHNVQPEDFGEYSLTMNNSIGTYVADYELVPYDAGPYSPTELYCTEVTSDSVVLHWTSGYDMGHRQHFNILKWSGNEFIQIDGPVYDYSHNHGIGDSFTHTVRGLESGRFYKLSISADNGYGSPAFSSNFVEFTTDYNPDYPTAYSPNHTLAIIVGCSAGGLAFIGFLAFIVYMVFYRRMTTSYENMKGKTFG